MGKSRFFFSQSVFGQLISLIDRGKFRKVVGENGSDRYCKRFTSWDHLVTLLFSSLGGCNSLREVNAGLLGLQGKTEQFGLGHISSKSTLSDANARRTPDLFKDVYMYLLKQYQQDLSDSRTRNTYGKSVVIMDSTTIGLFKAILKAAGRRPVAGRQKGGMKVHTALNCEESLPRIIFFSAAASNDVLMHKHQKFLPENIYVFDKGYTDLSWFENLTTSNISFVTRQKENSTYTSLKSLDFGDSYTDGVLDDQIIEVPIRKNGKILRTTALRRVRYLDRIENKVYTFLTNIVHMEATVIAAIYKERWKIELMFKQLKQNFPLKYFLGDNQNAITVQIWIALIANLLITVIRNKVRNRSWSFSNIATFCRLHLFNYLHLIQFLNAPEKDWTSNKEYQLRLQLSG